MKKIAFAFFFIFAAVCLQAQTLTWDIKFLKGLSQESEPISQIIRMNTGEFFLISITAASDCFSYVIAYDSERQIHVLHDRPLRRGQEVFLGPITIHDPPGTETIYVIMSLERQAALERLIQNHKNNPGSRQHINSLLREIGRLQNTAAGLGEPPSVYIPGGGTTRSVSGELIVEYMTRFTERNNYVRPITIRH